MEWDRPISRPPNGGFLLAAQDSPNGLRKRNLLHDTAARDPKVLAASYRGSRYEGGYGHDDIGEGIHITSFFPD